MKSFNFGITALGLLAAAAGSSQANAALVYVGATAGASGNTINLETTAPGNQTDWKTGLDDGSDDGRVAGNDLWGSIGTQGFAAFDASLTAVWESTGSPADDAPQLQTTVSGLAPGLYDVYVLYSTASGAAPGWEITAGLNGGAQVEYDDTVGTVLSTIAPFELRGVLLGQVSGTSFTVEANDDDQADANRTRYVGVAYELVPEPSSLALLCLGGLIVARRRRG